MDATPPRAPPRATIEPATKFLRLPDVLARVGCSKSLLYQMMREGRFPRSTRYSPGFVVWPESEVSAWIERYRASTPAPALN